MIASSTTPLALAANRPSATPNDEPDADRDDADQQRDARAGEDLARRRRARAHRVPSQCAAEGSAELVRHVDRGRRIGRPDERQQRREATSNADADAAPEAQTVHAAARPQPRIDRRGGDVDERR